MPSSAPKNELPSDKYYNAGNIFSPIQYMNIFKYSFQKDILPSVVKLTFSTMM